MSLEQLIIRANLANSTLALFDQTYGALYAEMVIYCKETFKDLPVKHIDTLRLVLETYKGMREGEENTTRLKVYTDQLKA